MRLAILLALSLLLVASVAMTSYFIMSNASLDDVPENVTGPMPNRFTENSESNFTSYTIHDIIYRIGRGGIDYSDLAATAYEPNVFRSVQHIYGALPPSTYDAYSVRGTIAICVDIDWVPTYAKIVVSLYNSTTNWLNGISAEGGSLRGWCPSTDGYDEFLVMNWYRWGVYIAYSGNLTKIYW